jgi:small subunit ribosomal protein S1
MSESYEDLATLLSEIDQVPEPQRGDLLQGCVLSADKDGLIVDLGLKRDGVVPRSDLEKLPEEEAVFRVGSNISVMVIDPLDRDGNLSVSISQARESEDWIRAHQFMEDDTILELKPVAFNRGGLIVPFGRLRGFIPTSHISGLPRGMDDEERTDQLQKLVGQKMPFKILEVDPRRRRLVLSERKAIRQWRQDRKSRLLMQLKEGDTRKGVVTSLREFGAFVDIGGADGLIHISELSWSRVDDPGQILSVGQEVEVLVIRLDHQSKRIGLSLKRLETNPWDEASERIGIGQVLDGIVTHLAVAGVYIRVADGPEGLLRSPNGPGDLVPGVKVQVCVRTFEPERERLELELVTISEEHEQLEERETIQEGGET